MVFSVGGQHMYAAISLLFYSMYVCMVYGVRQGIFVAQNNIFRQHIEVQHDWNLTILQAYMHKEPPFWQWLHSVVCVKTPKRKNEFIHTSFHVLKHSNLPIKRDSNHYRELINVDFMPQLILILTILLTVYFQCHSMFCYVLKESLFKHDTYIADIFIYSIVDTCSDVNVHILFDHMDNNKCNKITNIMLAHPIAARPGGIYSKSRQLSPFRSCEVFASVHTKHQSPS